MKNVPLPLGKDNIRLSFKKKVAFNQLFKIYDKTIKKNCYEFY